MSCKITFDNLPQAIELLLKKVDSLEKALTIQAKSEEKLPSTIPLKKAAELAGKTANALRVQISLGNLKCLHRGSRIYLDTEYFQQWLRGETDLETNPLEILKK